MCKQSCNDSQYSWSINHTYPDLTIRNLRRQTPYFFDRLFWSWSADKFYFHPQLLKSLKSTLPLTGLQHMSYNALQVKTFDYLFLLHAFDPNEWCMKNNFLREGLSSLPPSHESSALTTRERLLAKTGNPHITQISLFEP